MTLEETKQAVESFEQKLASQPFITIAQFSRNNLHLELSITERFRKKCRKGGIWKSRAMLTALKNAAYGFDLACAKSPGGKDGIFLITRDHSPSNAMMRKIFNRFLDNPNSGVGEIADALKCKIPDLFAVRLVSHHMRLIGVLYHEKQLDRLVLVDYDNTK